MTAARWTSTVTRGVAVVGVVAAVGLAPWLAGRDPALSVLRARAGEQEPTAEALDAIRRELGIENAHPLTLFGDWLTGLLRGELGQSWVTGDPVLSTVLTGAGSSLTLMAAAMVIALIIAVLLCIPVLVRGVRATPRRSAGGVAALLVAVPEFLLATVLLVVVAVWWGWLPPYGWQGFRHLVLPALALGVPAGALLGRLADDALAPIFNEHWVVVWRSWGCRSGVLVRAVVRRALPPVLPQLGLVVVGLTGGAVAVEVVFAVPGLGRTALAAAESQDLPLVQASIIALMLLGGAGGVIAAVLRRRLLGPALNDAALTAPPHVQAPAGVGHRVLVVVTVATLGIMVGWGLLREPLRLDTGARLAPPSWLHPLGTDSLGRDVLARVGHGALTTLGIAVVVGLCSFIVAMLLGLLPGVARALAETANAVPPVIAGLLVVAAVGPGAGGAAMAVGLVSWPALTSHAAALVEENRAASHIEAQRALGAPPMWTLTRHVLPAVAGPIARHAVLRLPGIALALASLGFLGLGSPPPAPEWGLTLAESLPYVERAPWASLAPSGALLLVAVFAVALATLAGRRGSSR